MQQAVMHKLAANVGTWRWVKTGFGYLNRATYFHVRQSPGSYNRYVLVRNIALMPLYNTTVCWASGG